MLAEQPRNWAGNVTFTPERVHRPRSVEELQELVAAGGRVRVLGAGHSFNRIADTTGVLVSVADLPEVVEVDRAVGTVRVSAGMRYGEVAERLHAEGLALHNLGSLPHVTVAGACATATHGSGDRNGTLASAVTGVEMVGADGGLVRLRRGDADFDGAVVALGAPGVVTHLTLDTLPAFDLRQLVYAGLPLRRLGVDFEEVFASAYSVSVFTDWRRPGAEVWVKARVDDGWPHGSRWLGATVSEEPRHPVPGMSPVNCTEQRGVPGPWHERLPHFRLGFTPSSGEELQAEYLLPRTAAPEAFAAMSRLGDRIAPVVQISEVRTVAAEELWLSTSHGRDTVAIHFTWWPDAAAVAPVMAAVEQELAPLGARPHWGKLSGVPAEQVRDRYPRAADFARLLDRYDPSGRFRNEFVDTYFPPAGV